MTHETTPSSAAEQETTPYEPLSSPAADPFPGEFRLVRRIGAGAFGEVWLADDLSPLSRQGALKFVSLSGQLVSESQARAVLQNDARLLASLHHPHIVQVHAWR